MSRVEETVCSPRNTSVSALHNQSFLLPCPFHAPAAQTSLNCCQKVRDLAMTYFSSTVAEGCWATSPNYWCGKEIQTTLSDWPEILCQGFALPLSHWNELTSPFFCKNYQGIMQTLGYTHSSHHTFLLRMAAWWKRKQNLTVHHVTKLKGFDVPTHKGPIQTCLSLGLMLALHTMSK